MKQPESMARRIRRAIVLVGVICVTLTALGTAVLFQRAFGNQLDRDLAYHQGTVWPFPLGGYYLAELRLGDFSVETIRRVSQDLDALLPALREGCLGQLPEIYDGAVPGPSRGCFAQAWSVGELLRVCEALERPAAAGLDNGWAQE